MPGAPGADGSDGAPGATGPTGSPGPQNVTLLEQRTVQAGDGDAELAVVGPFTLTAGCVDDAGAVTAKVAATTEADGSFASGESSENFDSGEAHTLFSASDPGGHGTFALVGDGADVSGVLWDRVAAGAPATCVFGGFAAATGT